MARGRGLAVGVSAAIALVLPLLGCAARGGSERGPAVDMAVEPAAVAALQQDEAWAVGDAVEYRVVQEQHGSVQELQVSVELEEVRPLRPDDLVATSSHNCPSAKLAERIQLSMLYTPAVLSLSVREAGRSVCRERIDNTALYAFAAQSDPSQCAGGQFMKLFNLALEVDCLSELLFQVADRPSLGSILANGGRVQVRVRDLRAHEYELELLQTLAGPLETVRMEGRIEANGLDALHFRAWVGYLRPPLVVTSSIVRLEAWKPSDPEVRVTAELSGLRRGPVPVIVPDDALEWLVTARTESANATAQVPDDGWVEVPLTKAGGTGSD